MHNKIVRDNGFTLLSHIFGPCKVVLRENILISVEMYKFTKLL